MADDQASSQQLHQDTISQATAAIDSQLRQARLAHETQTQNILREFQQEMKEERRKRDEELGILRTELHDARRGSAANKIPVIPLAQPSVANPLMTNPFLPGETPPAAPARAERPSSISTRQSAQVRFADQASTTVQEGASASTDPKPQEPSQRQQQQQQGIDYEKLASILSSSIGKAVREALPRANAKRRARAVPPAERRQDEAG